jgi:Ca2+-binding EF-hand superfamily protein
MKTRSKNAKKARQIAVKTGADKKSENICRYPHAFRVFSFEATTRHVAEIIGYSKNQFTNHNQVRRENEMKNSKMMLFATAIMLCLAATVMAQPPGGERGERGERGRPGGERGGERGGPGGERGRGGPGGDPGRMMQMMPVLKALDADQDGVISKAEINNAASALATLDKNGDGELDAEELRPDFAAMRGGRGGERGRGGPGGEAGRGGPGGGPGGKGGGAEEFIKRIMSQDTDDDGKISKDEAPERMSAMFDRLDGNSDGFVDKAELKEMASRMGGRGGRGGEGGARRERPGRGGEGGGGGQRPKRPESDDDA